MNSSMPATQGTNFAPRREGAQFGATPTVPCAYASTFRPPAGVGNDDHAADRRRPAVVGRRLVEHPPRLRVVRKAVDRLSADDRSRRPVRERSRGAVQYRDGDHHGDRYNRRRGSEHDDQGAPPPARPARWLLVLAGGRRGGVAAGRRRPRCAGALLLRCGPRFGIVRRHRHRARPRATCACTAISPFRLRPRRAGRRQRAERLEHGQPVYLILRLGNSAVSDAD
jgi:hypothetical protein